MKIDYGYGEVEVKFSVWAQVMYEQEFDGADYVTDLLGMSTVKAVTLMKMLWASQKAADESLPPFKEWSRTIEGCDMDVILSEFVPNAKQMFFRPGAAVSGETGTDE